MKSCEGKLGRVFILRLEDGDVIPDCIEEFAQKEGIATGHVILVGGVGEGNLVNGPRVTDQRPPDPVLLPVEGAHEIAGVGVLAPNAAGRPVLHMHAALGRTGKTMTGCVRYGVKTWLTAEAIIYEITGGDTSRVKRLIDKKEGLELNKVKTQKSKLIT